MLDRAFDVEEIDLARTAGPVLGAAGAGAGDRDAARFARGAEPRADLEQLHVAAAVTPVVGDRVNETGEQRRPQRVELRRERIRDADRIGKNRGERGSG